jgi:hypothetical protein
MVCGNPPDGLTFRNFPSATYAIHRPSGDQNGPTAPSVPGKACAVKESMDRNQSNKTPWAVRPDITR